MLQTHQYVASDGGIKFYKNRLDCDQSGKLIQVVGVAVSGDVFVLLLLWSLDRNNSEVYYIGNNSNTQKYIFPFISNAPILNKVFLV